MKNKLSIQDIAFRLKISPTTVSFIINGKAKEKRISDQLVAKVESYINEVGYTPSSLARSLRTGKSKIIGLMVESIDNPFFASIARLIETKAYNNGYRIIYSSTDNDTKRARELIKMFRDRHVDGYIISPPQGIEDDIKSLVNFGVPVVFFDRYLPGLEVDTVTIDNDASTYNAVSDLIRNGREHIAFITLDSMQTQMQDRLSGYKRAVEEYGLIPQIKKISFHQDPANIAANIKSFFENETNLDAVLYSTNYLGVSGLKTMRAMGIDIPHSIAVITFDDHELFELHTPSISAIAQPVEEIADTVINLLLSKLDSASSACIAERIVLQGRMIIRDSSKRR